MEKKEKPFLAASVPQLQLWAAESWPAANAINFTGPAEITDGMIQRLPKEARMVNYTSVPTSFYGRS